ncbi:hypothetical protein FDECE_12576 [Fusarium decemcellulare]|nr:hypothetical protein FDECE_12576 [Fusarium decemcellulare]
MISKSALRVLGALSLALGAVNGDSDGAERIHPDHEYARERANMVFNAIHSAGRQWGSSLYHNGFGFFPVIVPEGTLFYHGTHQQVPPPGPEWLAFEIEHAENFAVSTRPRRGDGHGPPPRNGEPPPKDGKPRGQKPLGEEGFREELRRRGEHDASSDESDRRHGPGKGDGDDEQKNRRGYLHTYQTTRDLNLLLLDGMSAGKTNMGTLDSQDLVIRENKTSNGDVGWDELVRAVDLCDVVTEWGYDGLVRVEIGFEIIHCNFSSGVDLASVTRTELYQDTMGNHELSSFQWARAVGERYNDIGGDRLRIDFSSMVSGLFFPINISSTQAERPDLMRLGTATLDELKDIKGYLKDVATQPRRFTVNWQGLVDLIVSRFSKRLAMMAYESLPSNYFIDEVEAATLTWFDAPPLPNDANMAEYQINRTTDAVQRCRKHFLRPALLARERWSLEDDLIYTSVDSVMQTICTDLFSVRTLLIRASGSGSSDYKVNKQDSDDAELDRAVETGRAVVQQLVDTLGWSTWKQRQPCAPDEVLFIAMWPFGEEDDHWNPGCRSVDQIRQPSSSYWRGHQPPKPGPPPPRRTE